VGSANSEGELNRAVDPVDVDLRPFETDDLAAVELWVRDIDPAASAAEWLAAALAEAMSIGAESERHRFTFAITERGAVVGAVLLSIDSAIDARAEIGFVVGRRQRRRGIARHAIALLVQHAFDDADLHRLWAACDPNNAAAIAALVGNGFAVEGRLVHDRRIGTEWSDSLILGRIADR